MSSKKKGARPTSPTNVPNVLKSGGEVDGKKPPGAALARSRIAPRKMKGRTAMRRWCMHPNSYAEDRRLSFLAMRTYDQFMSWD